MSCFDMSSATGPAVRTDDAQQRADAGIDLFEVKGLDHVVIGAGRQSVDLVLPAIARRQDQYRVGLAGVPQGANDIDAGYLRKPQVDDREINGVLECLVLAFPAVRRLFDGKAFGLQLLREGFAQRVVIFDDEQSHGDLP